VVPLSLYRLFIAVLLVAVAYYGSKLLRSAIGRRIARRFQRPSVTRTILRGIQTGIVLLAGLAGLVIIGIPLSDLTISLSVFSAVLGVILAPIVGSVISGVFVISERPYEVGDMVQIVDTDTYGFFEDVTLRYTKIFTLDNTFLLVPNGKIRERDVVNFSAEDARTRLKLDVLVTYESDIPQARRLIERAARRTDAVIEGGPEIRIGGARYPAAPTAFIDEFADNGVNIRLRYWVNEPYKLLTIRSRVQTNVWDELADADVEIAYPHSHLVFDETSGEMQVSLRQDDGSGPRPRKRGRATTSEGQPETPQDGAGLGDGGPGTGE